MKIVMGIRLIRNEVFTVLVMVSGVFFRLSEMRGKMMGVSRTVRVSSMDVFRASGRSITFTWICTKMSGS